jgi:hypothetical protein
MRLFYFVKFYLKYFLFLFSNLTTLKTFANLYFNELFFFPFLRGCKGKRFICFVKFYFKLF